jgi:1-pyrroline-5-carboxylate dehydrogenase
MGDPTDFANFMGAVIDDRAFRKHSAALDAARTDASLTVLAGGTADDSEGWFVRPTIIEGANPRHEVFTTEYFGPILSVFVYDDAEWPRMLREVDEATPYALTGAVFSQDRGAVAEAMSALRFSAGNFYVNDKPTGAVVGQQPFGGARASGTNDKAGSMWNLMRWTSPRALKENFVPPVDWRYPHMG